jgi:hypothetical protein
MHAVLLVYLRSGSLSPVFNLHDICARRDKSGDGAKN